MLPLASPWARLGANILDRMIVIGGGVAVAIILAVVAAVLGSSIETSAAFAGGGTVLSLVGVQVHQLVTRGQTLGKRALGLRIVDEDGNIPAWGKLLVAREGSRYAMGLVPYLGVVLSLGDALMIFGERHQTLHDKVAGTYVIIADGNGVPARAPGGGTGGVPVVAMVLVLGVGGIFVIGVLAAIAIPNFVTMQLRAKRAEVPDNLDSIRAAEGTYFMEKGRYLAASSEAEATASGAGKEEHDFPFDPGWIALEWHPGGQVRGVYWVELTPEGFAAYGACDVDGDGEYAVYVATESQNAQLTTPRDVY
ncbi:MAG: RDD family protein [Deltaproteobacteria bacterium]|nr:RDD family protein [Deltaproteobacteria bacterium]